MIKTWRERLRLGEAYPLHAPTDVERAMEAEIAELRAAVAAPAPSDALTINPMCERKTNNIMAREGYEKTGYVLRKAGADICVSDGGAVAWFTPEQWNWLMFGRMRTTFEWPKPIGWAAPVPDADTPTAGAVDDDADNLSVMLWLLRRLPRAYGNPPNVVRPILKLANRLGTNVSDFLAEREEPAND